MDNFIDYNVLFITISLLIFYKYVNYDNDVIFLKKNIN